MGIDDVYLYFAQVQCYLIHALLHRLATWTIPDTIADVADVITAFIYKPILKLL